MTWTALMRLGFVLGVAAVVVACARRIQPPSDVGVCWILADGAFATLDPAVDNLETCGARLEVAYLRQRRPVTGAYGGVWVFVDAREIAAAAPHGVKARLLDPGARRRLDAAIGVLMHASGERLTP